MARIAVYRRPGEDIVDVAIRAGQRGVRPGESVAGVLQVIELGPEPAIHRVAAFASGRESGSYVIDDRCLKILLMAGVAGGRESLELPYSGALMAFVALHQSVCAYQRKAVLVVLDRIQRNMPACHRMAALTVGAELAAMNVCVAISAMGAYVLEDEAGMAGGAGYLLVHAAKGVGRLIVVKLGVG